MKIAIHNLSRLLKSQESSFKTQSTQLSTLNLKLEAVRFAVRTRIYSKTTSGSLPQRASGLSATPLSFLFGPRRLRSFQNADVVLTKQSTFTSPVSPQSTHCRASLTCGRIGVVCEPTFSLEGPSAYHCWALHRNMARDQGVWLWHD